MSHRLAAAAVLTCALLIPAVADAAVKTGDAAPIAMLKGLVDMDGRPYDAASSLMPKSGAGGGNATLFVFWASWCHPCISEIPVLNELHRFYGNRGLHVIGIGLRENGETLDGIRKAAQEHGVTYPVLFDSEGKGQELFGVAALPTSILLSATGKVLWSGPALPNDITERIAAALGQGGELGTK